MKLRHIIFLLALFVSVGARADEPVRFSASAPSTVVLDQPFQIVYTVNATGKDLKTSDFNNFEVLAGPFESRSSSYQIVNGKASSSVSVSYTYTLQATKTGTFTISAASIVVDNKRYNSNGLSIKVLPADDNSSQQGAGKQGKSGKTQSAQNISDENIFIKTE